MPFVQVPRVTPTRINYNQHAQNSKVPSPTLITETRQALNNALRYRGRELFRADNGFGVGVGSAVRHRFTFRSSPFPRSIAAKIIYARNGHTSGTGFVELALSGGGVARHYTSAIAAVTNDFSELTEATLIIPAASIAADVDITASITDNLARTVAICVYELGPIENTINGYCNPLWKTGDPIDKDDRNVTAALANKLQRRGCAHVFNFCPDLISGGDTQAPSTVAVVGTNMIDGSTTPSASTAGYTLDMQFKQYESNANVPMIIWHYGNCSAAGSFTLRNSAGSIIVTIAVNGTDAWRGVGFVLPSTLAKYDLYHQGAGGSAITTKAICCYQLRA